MQRGYRTSIDRHYLDEEAHRLRWMRTMAFVGASAGQQRPPLLGLDLGDRTPLSQMLEEHFGCTFRQSAVDLDVEPLRGSYDVVTAFEVLEHLFNPLHALLSVRSVMAGPQARLFVSMPLDRPSWLRSPDHFHEMSRSEALALFDRAGFEPLRSARFRIRRPAFYLSGLRPFLRLFFESVQIYELAKRP